MKTILLYANDDSGMESRLQATLDVARAFEAHVSCVQATPFDRFIMGDPFGGVYALPTVVAAVRDAEEKHRASIEARLAREKVSWDWSRFDGEPAQVVVGRSRLSDLVVLSLNAPGGHDDGALSMVSDTVLHLRAPALAVPPSTLSFDCLGAAVVAWNGAAESAHALRLTLPMLRMASEVHIVTVTDDRAEFPATGASEYLARHGIGSELNEWPRGDRSVGAALADAMAAKRGSYLVMGAYGHSRLRETVLGGTTRELLRRGDIPLLLAH
jgi:nucleotide-binding universal stress UspA family protein